MAEVNRGKVWQFSFPSPNKRRPVLILTRQEIISQPAAGKMPALPV